MVSFKSISNLPLSNLKRDLNSIISPRKGRGLRLLKIITESNAVVHYNGSAEGHGYPDLQVGDEVNPRPLFLCWLNPKDIREFQEKLKPSFNCPDQEDQVVIKT